MKKITKKIIVLLILITTIGNPDTIVAQSDCTDANTGNIVTGSNYKYCDGKLKSNSSGVVYNGTSKTKYRSTTHIQLKPGFVAGQYTGQGYFNAYINSAEFSIIEPTAAPFGQFEKIEFALKLNDIDISRNDYDSNWNFLSVIGVDLNSDIEYFFDDVNSNPKIFPSPHTNPYDPDDIEIEITFTHTATSEDFTTWAFYYRDFEYDRPNPSMTDLPEAWNELGANNGWRVRFAPPKTGDYTAKMKITCYKNTNREVKYEYFDLAPFTVIPSSNDGYLQFNSGAKYMSYSKTPAKTFFPIGNNLISASDGNKYTDYPAEYLFNREYVKNLKGRGNYARFSINVNGYWVEWENPGSYDSHQNTMWELDQLVNTAKESDVYLLMSLMIWEEFTTGPGVGNAYATDGDNFTRDFFGEHPYKSSHQFGDKLISAPAIDQTNPLNDFFAGAAAIKLLKNRIRYIISRWGYSTNISAYDIFGEIDNTIIKWGLTASGVPARLDYNVEGEPGLQYNARLWVKDIAQDLAANDQNHLKTVCLFANGIYANPTGENVFDVEELDYVAFDDYKDKRNDNIDGRFYGIDNIVNNYTNNPSPASGQAGLNNVNPWKKPVELLEMGGTVRQREIYHPSSVHNAFWSISFTGSMGAGSYFYKHYISDIGLKKIDINGANSGSIYDIAQTNFNGIDFEINQSTGVITPHRFLTGLWPGYISDANAQVRLDLNGNPIGSLEDLNNRTPDFNHHLQTLNEFTNEILPAAGINLQNSFRAQVYPDNDADIDDITYTNNNELEAFTLVKSDGKKAVGWVHNRSSYWGNMNFANAFNDGSNECVKWRTMRGFSGDGHANGCVIDIFATEYLYNNNTYVPYPPLSWPNAPADNSILDPQDDIVESVQSYTNPNMPTFNISGLEANGSYEIRWYNTLGNNVSTGLSILPGAPPTEYFTDSSGNLLTLITPPNMTDNDAHDYAFILAKDGDFNPFYRLTPQEVEEKEVVISQIKVVPNPNKGRFTLYLEAGFEGEVLVQLLNTIGKVVREKTILGNRKVELNIENESKGVYFIKVQSGNEVRIEKIVKH